MKQQLPTGWRRARLGFLAETQVPQRDKPDPLTGPIPWVRIEDFNGRDIRASKSGQGVTPEQVRVMNLRIFEPGTVMCSCSCSMGATAIVREPLVSNQTFIGLKPGKELESRFLFYLMGSMRDELQANATGAIQQYLSRDDFRSLRIPVPPPEEQLRIADFLDAETARIDQGIETAAKGRQLLDERRWATVHALSTGADTREARREVRLGWVDQIPDSWKVVPLKFVASLGSGHTPSRSKPEYWENCTIPWISLFDVGRMRNVRQTSLLTTQQQISALGMENSSACLHPAGTVALSRTASVGFSTIMGVDMAVSQHFVTWTCGKDLLPQYLLMLLRSMRQYFESVQVGTTNVTVFMPDLYAIKIPLPPVEVQHRVVRRIQDTISKIDALAERFDRQLSLLRERRQALITAAVTGQFDVTTASGRNVTEGVSA
ncbi:restriction endonuclease subunit S [Streptomyces edwardsiae]|uniref:Restriction endonuclease subunit S n=1 Tax=Streptomyces edwardsiae TaxID=3075527 RepID=A0ABU2QC22_9ACTN|nr:restriction endonuclease subunit S [Streptomyces sp. DSM 41635]MDT0401997.1 restriction endonuclease subunit S [Streptomyces sp. DSM 41635]